MAVWNLIAYLYDPQNIIIALLMSPPFTKRDVPYRVLHALESPPSRLS
jgi:hypothetical protein